MESDIKRALQTIGGAIFYQLKRHGDKEITPHDWQYLAYFIVPTTNALFCIQELTDVGFTVSVSDKTFKYLHSEYHDKRIVQVT